MKSALFTTILVFFAALQASATTFSFSITDDPSVSAPYSTGGTITGRIFGLVDNTSNQAATSIIIDSLPAAFDLAAGTDVVNDAFWNFQNGNNFGVVNGQITHADFGALHNSSLPIFSFTLSLTGGDNNGGSSGLLENTGEIVRRAQTLTPVYTGAEASGAPEPSALSMIALGMAGVASLVRRRR